LQERFSLFLKEFHIDEKGEKVEAMYREHLNQGHKTVTHAHELLNALSKQDYNLYIGTNGVGKTQRKRLEGAKLQGYFEQLFISEEIGYEKPNPQFFYYIFDALHTSRIGLSMSELIVYGLTLREACLNHVHLRAHIRYQI
jgi:HAD superfamily hydrolase (TIGR01549 family)